MNQTTRDQILEWICLSAEVPYSSLFLIDAEKKTIQQTLYRLKSDKYIQIFDNGSYKTVRLFLLRRTNDGASYEVIKYIEENLGTEYVEYYLSQTNNHHFDGHIETVKRRMRGSEIIQLLKRANVQVIPWNMKWLSFAGDMQDAGATPCYFTAKQLNRTKRPDTARMSKDDAKKEFTRYYGLLLSKGGAYVVYNLDIGIDLWSSSGEIVTKRFMTNVARNNWDMPDYMKLDRWTQEISYEPDAIFIIRNDQAALKILNGRSLKNLKQDTLTVHSKVHYIQLSESGIFQLWLLTQEDFHERLKRVFLFPEYVYPRGNRFDGFVDEQIKIILWFNGDLNRLRYIKELMNTNKYKFIILCFPFQEAILHEYLNKSFETKIYDEEDIVNILDRTNV